MGEVLDFERLDARTPELQGRFARGEPFPHVVIDDFLEPESAERVLQEFTRTDAGWDHYHHYNEKKQAVTHLDRMLPYTRAVFDVLQSRRFVDWVEKVTGISELISDPELDGAGLHRVMPGGFLNVHADFLAHTTNRSWSRQINLLLYMNKDWKSEWNGDLEFWDADMQRPVTSVSPLFNRCVLFHTREKSYHGHPRKLGCPADRCRMSLALYYFQDLGRPLDVQSTYYRALPDDSRLKKALVAADRGALRAYSFLKRYTGVSDGLANRILKRF